MGYSQASAAWNALRELPDVIAPGDRAALAKALREHASAFETSGKPDGLCEGDANGDALIAFFLHADAVVVLARIPAARLDETMLASLQHLHRQVFADPMELEADAFDAAVRVLASLAMEFRSADELASWARAGESTVGDDEIHARWDAWRGIGLRDWSEMRTPVARVCAFARAM